MGEIKGRFFISNKQKPCALCKKLTNQIEIKSEKRVCSDKCLSLLDDDLSIKKVIYIRFNGFNNESFEIIDKVFYIEDNVYNLLMKSSENNFIDYFIKISNFLGDYALLNSSLLDSLIETGDVICFEKNRKKIINKSSKYNCYLNIEMKTLSSYFQFQILDLPSKDLKEFTNVFFIRNKLS